MSKVPDASWAPCANSSSAVGARWMRDTVALATIQDGRSFTMLKLMLLGVAERLQREDRVIRRGDESRREDAGGAVEADGLDAAASSVRKLSVSHSSL